MANNGIWQHVADDGQLYPVTEADLAQHMVQYSAHPETMLGDFGDNYEALLVKAAAYFGIDREALHLYYYTDNPEVVRVVAAREELNVLDVPQPMRVELALYVDPVSGLIQRPGLLDVKSFLFNAALPISRR